MIRELLGALMEIATLMFFRLGYLLPFKPTRRRT
jgi:hypothetical protein